MIYGIGTDLAEISRINAVYQKYPQQYPSKILSELELFEFAKKNNKVSYLAKRFAVKEAFAKACGTGLRYPVTLTSISVLNNELGQPYLHFNSELQAYLDSCGIVKCHVSISDEKLFASAFVILEK